MERNGRSSSRAMWSYTTRPESEARADRVSIGFSARHQNASPIAQDDRLSRARPWSKAASPEEASRLCGAVFHPHLVKPLGSARNFEYRQHVAQLGPVTIGDFSYETDVCLEFDEAREGYDVIVPVAGRLDVRHRGMELSADVEAAAVSRPDGEKTVVRWIGGSRVLAVRIEQHAVDTALQRLIGLRPDSPFVLGPGLPLKDADVQSWLQLVTAMGRVKDSDTPAWRSLVSEPLVESLVHGFLLLTDHPYREALRAPVSTGNPSVVRLAIQIMKTGPGLPLTISDLAVQCHVSVRTLQAGFQRHLGISPMAYLREERLRRAHADLRSADPLSSSVATIAHRWGFSHLGRFSAAHKARYGQTPAQTLRSRSS